MKASGITIIVTTHMYSGFLSYHGIIQKILTTDIYESQPQPLYLCAYKNIVLHKVRLETGKKTCSYQGEITFNSLTEEMKSEKSILRFKTLCRDFDFNF